MAGHKPERRPLRSRNVAGHGVSRLAALHAHQHVDASSADSSAAVPDRTRRAPPPRSTGDPSAPGPTVAAMEGRQACREQERLSHQERHVLDTLPDAANEIDFTVLSCLLEAGHVGPHLALGQIHLAVGRVRGARVRWLQWVPGERREWLDLEDHQHCDVKGPPASDIPDDRPLCLLPAGHPGGHSFETRQARIGHLLSGVPDAHPRSYRSR